MRPGAPVVDPRACGIRDMLDVFYMKDPVVRTNLQGSLAHLGLAGEWGLFMQAVMSLLRPIVELSKARSELLSTREIQVRRLLKTPLTPNVIEVFGVIERQNFPRLWRLVVRLLTVMLTTVACEQSFSYFKRTLHANMSEQTARNFLFSRLSLYNSFYKL